MPQQPDTVMKKRKLYNTMAFDSKPLKKIDYAGDFDKELAKFEKVDGVETNRDRELKDKVARKLRAKSMMRTSLPTEPRYREDVDPDGSDLEDMKAGSPRRSRVKSVGKMASGANRSNIDPELSEIRKMMGAGVITEQDKARYRQAMKSMNKSKK